MKRNIIILFISVGCIMPFMYSCSKNDYPARYELKDGDPKYDYMEFLSDSTLRFYTPDDHVAIVKYKQQEGIYTVYVSPLVTATLTRIDKTTLTGSVPFFEGTWKKK